MKSPLERHVNAYAPPRYKRLNPGMPWGEQVSETPLQKAIALYAGQGARKPAEIDDNLIAQVRHLESLVYQLKRRVGELEDSIEKKERVNSLLLRKLNETQAALPSQREAS